jgi:MFS family permease
LIGARALQGIGAALLTPGSLAILEAAFVPADRAKVIGAWSGLTGVASAVGPFLGGWLVQAASWRLIFAINLPKPGQRLRATTSRMARACVGASDQPAGFAPSTATSLPASHRAAAN